MVHLPSEWRPALKYFQNKSSHGQDRQSTHGHRQNKIVPKIFPKNGNAPISNCLQWNPAIGCTAPRHKRTFPVASALGQSLSDLVARHSYFKTPNWKGKHSPSFVRRGGFSKEERSRGGKNINNHSVSNSRKNSQHCSHTPKPTHYSHRKAYISSSISPQPMASSQTLETG